MKSGAVSLSALVAGPSVVFTALLCSCGLPRMEGRPARASLGSSRWEGDVRVHRDEAIVQGSGRRDAGDDRCKRRRRCPGLRLPLQQIWLRVARGVA